jgi:hypothetical protein
MAGPEARLVGWDKELHHEISSDEDVDLRAAFENFLVAARKERFLSLLTAEQNYTEFLTAQVSIQLEEIKTLQQAVSGD